MTKFGTIFEAKISYDELRDLLGHFDEKDTIDFNIYMCFIRHNSLMLYVLMT